MNEDLTDIFNEFTIITGGTAMFLFVLVVALWI